MKLKICIFVVLMLGGCCNLQKYEMSQHKRKVYIPNGAYYEEVYYKIGKPHQ